MEARNTRLMGVAALVVLFLVSSAHAQFGRQKFTAQSQNFIVFASSPQWASQVAEMAELNRRNLAIHWLGEELPPWSERVPVHVQAAPTLGAGGETRFSLLGGNRVGNWMMSVQGTQERILDSVLPHEITHTIFATHFARYGKYVPRWADEGACTTVEHISEKRKHQHFLHEFLRTGRGLAFNQMFSLKEYPNDILPLYAQGHSAVQFLLDQGGPRKFILFLETGMRTDAWDRSLQEHYAYQSIGQFQTLWNQWLADGSPEDILAYAPGLQASSVSLASATESGLPLAGDTFADNNASPASLHLIGNQTALANPAENESIVAARQPSDPLALAATPAATAQTLGNESWYKRRLQEVNAGNSANPAAAPTAANPTAAAREESAGRLAASSYPLQPYQPPTDQRFDALEPQSTARPLPAQSTGVQVLDWGNSVPVPGIQQSGIQQSGIQQSGIQQSGIRQSSIQQPATGMVPLYR